MQIVDASYEIIEPALQKMTVLQRLETCGRICYKSEDKITETSAIPFCKKMIANEHMATMEMVVLHFRLNYFSQSTLDALMTFKYLKVKSYEDSIVVSGSLRAFIEAIRENRSNGLYLISQAIQYEFPELGLCYELNSGTERYAMRLNEIYAPYEHKSIAVKFIVNRAVTHEIVRHRPCTFLQESQRYCNYSADKFGNEVTFINPKAFFPEILDINDPNEELNIWTESMKFAEQQYFKLLKTSSPQAARTVLPNSCKTEIIVYTDTTEWEHIFKLRVPKSAEPSMREVMIPLEIEMRERGFLKPKV